MQATQMTQLLAEMGALRSMARELGVTEKQVRNGAEALLPAILGGLEKQAQSHSEDLESLGDLIAELGGGDLLDNVLAPRPTDVSRGNEVLARIFGSKDASRRVAKNAASQCGLELYLLNKMLPMLAMLVAGYGARRPGEGAPREASAGDDILRRTTRSMHHTGRLRG